MKIAALQMVSGPRVAGNLAIARELLERAASGGAELAVLPEYFSLLGLRERDKLAHAELPGDGPVQTFLAHAARELGLWIVGGTLPLACSDPGRVRNSSLAFSPQGLCVARYDKVHLFRLAHGDEQIDEGRTIEPGDAPAQLHLTDRNGRPWCVGLSVCYDLRFPEFYRLHAAAGADLLVVPAAFTWTTGSAHWEVLLRARAIENQAFVVAAAQGGRHENGRRTWGQSLIADPWGQVLDALPEGVGLVLADADPRRMEEVRQQLPALSHRVF